jgi:copper chaperone
MSAKTVTIPSISCKHCTATIERTLGELKGVQKVTCDLPAKSCTIQWQEPANWESIAALLTEIGYEPK